MRADIMAEDRYNYRRQDGRSFEVMMQVSVPFETTAGVAVCLSAIVGIQDVEFECVSEDTFGALCGALRLMKEWVIERYAQGDRLCWITEDDDPGDESDNAPVPLWLLFSCRSKMTESDKVASEEMSAEIEYRVRSEKTEGEQQEHDERKAHSREVRDTPITNVAATARYYSITQKGQQIPSEIILEQPYVDDAGEPVVRFTMTTWYDMPSPSSSCSIFSALITVLRLGWFLLDHGCKHHNVQLFRDADNIHQTNPSEIYNHLFQPGD